MHRIGLWCSYKQANFNDFQFPYKASSPTLGKMVIYDEDELWNEIERILAEDQQKTLRKSRVFPNKRCCNGTRRIYGHEAF